MLRITKQTDERREATGATCWCLHGSVGAPADWRGLADRLAGEGLGSRAVDLWRFLECGPMSFADFAQALNAEVKGEVARGSGRVLVGYSLGGRLALHALLEPDHPWQAAVIVGAHPGLEREDERLARREADAIWAAKCFAGDWQGFLAEWNAQPVLGGAEARDPRESQRLMSRRTEIARGFVDWSLGAQEPLWERLGEIEVPVLWIAGERDGKFRELAERALPLLPQGRLRIAPQAGHRVPWDEPAWFTAEIASFLRAGA